AISRVGALQPFLGGVMKIVESHPVPVVPLALHDLWGSFFSRASGAAMTQPFRRGLWSRVGLSAAAPLAAVEVTPERLRERVAAMLAA
ncbi:MAG: glycerol acyltransferase, partial [Methylibium sp.]